MKTVILYTNAFFLDSALELANCIKKKVNLVFCIEITPLSKNATILNIDNIENCNLIESPENILKEHDLKKFQPYFDGMKAVYFIVHKNKKSFSPRTIWNSYKVGLALKKHKPTLWHFDNVSLRAVGMYPLINKLVLHLHDPVAHSGERNWRDIFKNKLFANKANAYLLYSQFSSSLFKKTNPGIKKPIEHISLQPYTFIQNFINEAIASKREYILFFGRISPYKGVDLLIKAIPLVLKEYPNAKFVIAGNPSYGCEISDAEIQKLSSNLIYIKGYLDIKQIADLIHNSQFVVCPYREATQSGVLYTTQALGKPLVCTRVGAFTEDIIDGKNGLLCDPDENSIAAGIGKMLHKEYYKLLEINIEKSSSLDVKEKIGSIIFETYSKAIL